MPPFDEEKMLAGKNIIITGAGTGLGRAYAVSCAAAGAAVVVNDVDADAAHQVVDTIRDRGRDAIAVAGSVADWSLAEHLSTRCREQFGRVDGLVANAGVMRAGTPWELDESDLRTVAEVNVLGVQFSVTHALRAMVADGRGGSIVTIVSGARFGIPGMSAYGASKGAVTAMTRNWALECAAHGIRVNSVSPLGRTAMALDDLRADRPELPDPTLIAPLIVALLSDGTKLNGRVLRFDGRGVGLYGTSLSPIAEQDVWTARLLADTALTEIGLMP